MYKTGHMGLNSLLYSPILFILMWQEYTAIGIAGLIITSQMASVPDIDFHYRYLKHRGFTHTFSFAMIVGIIFVFLTIPILLATYILGIAEPTYLSIFSTLSFSGLLGFFTVASHILGDIITPSGLRPFAKPPLIPNCGLFSDKRYTFGLVYAKNQMANGALLFFGVVSSTIAIYSSAVI
jgi:inner membrane protein